MIYENSPLKKYRSQKAKAKQRGIEFTLTFEEWWNIWQQSGKWDQRGIGTSTYVMSRYNDEGPYSVENVFIQSNADNIRDAKNTGRRKGSTHTEETKKLFSIQRKGRTPWNKGKPHTITTCPHCNKTGGINTITQWHMNNCKSLKTEPRLNTIQSIKESINED
jgi:hypothetical protein